MMNLLKWLFTFNGGGVGGSKSGPPATDPLGLTTTQGGGGLELGLPDPLALNRGSKEWNAAHAAPSSATTTTNPNLTPEELAARSMLINRASSIYGGQQGTYSSILGPSANTTLGQNMALGTATGPGQTLANQAGGAIGYGLSGAALNPNSVPGYDGALQAALRPINNAMTDPNGVLSRIRTNAMTSNSGGTGTREGIAGGIAGREYLNAIADTSSKMALDQYGKGLDFMSKSLALAPSTYNTMLQPATTVGAVGGQQEAYNKQQFNAPWLEMQPYVNMLNSFAGGAGTTTTSNAPAPNPGMVDAQTNQQALGTALMMMAMFA